MARMKEWRFGKAYPVVLQQSGLLPEAAKIAAHGEGARGEDDGPGLVPEGTLELGGQVRYRSAEHDGVAGILCQIEHHIRMTFAEQCHRRGQLFKPPAGSGREQGIDLLLYYRQRPVRGDQQPGIFGKTLIRIMRPFQLPKEETGGVRQGVRRQQVFLSPQIVDETLDVLASEGNTEHVPGCFRQLVGLIDDDGKAVRQPLLPDSIRL